jgi:hypothetical protein
MGMPEMRVKQVAGVVLRALMFVNMRKRSLHKRREQCQNDAESGCSKDHYFSLYAVDRWPRPTLERLVWCSNLQKRSNVYENL